MEPNHAEAHLLQGKIFHKLGQLPEAVAALEKAIQIQGEDSTQGPPKPNSFYYLGMCYEKTKDLKQAMASYKRCL